MAHFRQIVRRTGAATAPLKYLDPADYPKDKRGPRRRSAAASYPIDIARVLAGKVRFIRRFGAHLFGRFKGIFHGWLATGGAELVDLGHNRRIVVTIILVAVEQLALAAANVTGKLLEYFPLVRGARIVRLIIW